MRHCFICDDCFGITSVVRYRYKRVIRLVLPCIDKADKLSPWATLTCVLYQPMNTGCVPSPVHRAQISPCDLLLGHQTTLLSSVGLEQRGLTWPLMHARRGRGCATQKQSTCPARAVGGRSLTFKRSQSRSAHRQGTSPASP